MDDQPGNCQEILALLSDYLDLELPPEACHEIEHHLAECSPCEEFAESMRKTVDLCRGFKPHSMPGPLSEQARHELEAAYKKMLSTRRSAQSGA